LVEKTARIGFAVLASRVQALAPATAARTSASARARRVADECRKYIQKREWPGDSSVQVICPDDPVMNLDDASRAASLFRQSQVDALVIQYATHSPGNLTAELVRDLPVPLALWAVPEIQFESNPLNCGSMMSMLEHAASLTALCRRFTFVHGLPDADEARRDVDRFIRAVVVRHALRHAAIARVGSRPAGSYPCIVDELAIKGILGTEVHHVGVAEVLAQVGKLQQDEIDADLSSVRSGDYLIEASDAEAVQRSCAVHVALRRIVSQYGLAALAINCLPGSASSPPRPLSKLGEGESASSPPHSLSKLGEGEWGVRKLGICAAASRLTDAGTPTACSGDIDGALTMLIQHLYTGRPPFYGNWLQRDEKNNVVTFWNCGNAPASLVSPRFEPKITDSPSGSDNVILDFPLKTGDVTLARLQWSASPPPSLSTLASSHHPLSNLGWGAWGVRKYRMLLVRGRAVETPPALKGTFVNIRFEPPVRSLLETFLRYGFPPHVSIVYEDIEDDLREFALQAGIEVVEATKE